MTPTSPTMKLAYITSHYARASDTFIRNEVIELRQRGHQVDTYSIRRETSPKLSADILAEQARTTYILEQGVASLLAAVCWALLTRPAATLRATTLAWRTRVPGIKGLMLQLAYLVEAAFLGRSLLRQGTEILHNHIAENSATVAMYASIISGIPFSMTVHGPGIFYHPRQWALGEKVAHAAFTAAITHFCKSQCMLFSDAKHWPRIHVVRCTPGPVFATGAPTPPSAEPVFLFVGRLCAEKGLTILMDAFSMAVQRAQACGQSMRLVVVGDGPLRQEVSRMVSQQGLSHCVSLLGAQPSTVVRQELEKCRVFVLPSFAEGLPVSIMEAFSIGRPVISTQIAGISELVTHGTNGWLVPAGSPQDLADALLEAASLDTVALGHMADAAHQRVRQLHDFSQEVSKLEALLAQHRRACA